MSHPHVRFVFVTGGVISGLGKGIVASSLGMLLKSQGYKVTIQKFDPYFNLDPGTMNPYEHGEVFVTHDGGETDLDLGHYERFIDEELSRANSVTSGMVMWDVLNRERKGDYLGNTVMVIPQVAGDIKQRITKALEQRPVDVVITEIGGTVGDIEAMWFLEAARQFQAEHRERCVHIHVTLVPFLRMSGEFKTKPTQHSVKALREAGVSADIVVLRSEKPLGAAVKEKTSMLCSVPSVIECVDAKSIYDVPLQLAREGLDEVVLKHLQLPTRPKNLTAWQGFVNTLHNPQLPTLTIALVGKYTALPDADLSVCEALKHAAAQNNAHVRVLPVNAEDLEKQDVQIVLAQVDGILVPGGFGKRGIEGKIKAAKFAREKNVPYLGICLGMQIAAIEFGRNVLGLAQANSTEFDQATPDPIIDFLPDQRTLTKKGGTMRLGSYVCAIAAGSRLAKAYQAAQVSERHRHRYEFNNLYRDRFESEGMVFSGTSPDNALVEAMELKSHPWFVGCQFHPEFKSRPCRPHPLFDGLIKAVLDRK